ncbi:ring-type e3 ubiquitin transferase [Anaeramoeba flamelloides]|uniref:RING-type E3 ubiquitin transferase n=1 Tax=Anaeramoeba flamelloides TaxID=1746091 RepID=A0ABQ8XKN3_9EUKA|nr:ring-type e3 ubiquitin transferase [Anaeramoeba flamelloides]
MNRFHLVVVIGDQKTRIPIRQPDEMKVYDLITKIQQRNIFTPRKIVALRSSKGEWLNDQYYVSDLLESRDIVFCIFEDLLDKKEKENQKPRISKKKKEKEKEKEKEKLIPVPETIVPNFEEKGTNKETLTQGMQPNQSLDNSRRIVENYFNNDFLHRSQFQNQQGNDKHLFASGLGNVQSKIKSDLSAKLDYQQLLFEEKYYSESQLKLNPNEMVNNKNFDDQNDSNNKTTSTTTATTTSSTSSLTSSSYSSFSENESENENTNGNKNTKRYQNLNTNTIEIRKKRPQPKVNTNPNFDPNTENIQVEFEKVNVNQDKDGNGNKSKKKNKSESESESENVKANDQNKNFKKSEIKQINKNVNNDDILKEHEKKKGTKGKVGGDKENKRKQALMNLKNKKQNKNKNKNIKDLVMRSLSIDSDADSNQINEEFTKNKLQFEEELRNLKILVDGEEYEDFSDYSNLSLSDSSSTSNSEEIEEIEEIENIQIEKDELRITPKGNLGINSNKPTTLQVKTTTRMHDTISKPSNYTIKTEEDQKNLLSSKQNENQNQNQNQNQNKTDDKYYDGEQQILQEHQLLFEKQLAELKLLRNEIDQMELDQELYVINDSIIDIDDEKENQLSNSSHSGKDYENDDDDYTEYFEDNFYSEDEYDSNYDYELEYEVNDDDDDDYDYHDEDEEDDNDDIEFGRDDESLSSDYEFNHDYDEQKYFQYKKEIKQIKWEINELSKKKNNNQTFPKNYFQRSNMDNNIKPMMIFLDPKKKKKMKAKPPPDLTCPITFQLFKDPVDTPFGHTFERKAITRYINNWGICPITKRQLTLSSLSPSKVIKGLCERFKKEQGLKYDLSSSSDSELFEDVIQLHISENENEFQNSKGSQSAGESQSESESDSENESGSDSDSYNNYKRYNNFKREMSKKKRKSYLKKSYKKYNKQSKKKKLINNNNNKIKYNSNKNKSSYNNNKIRNANKNKANNTKKYQKKKKKKNRKIKNNKIKEDNKIKNNDLAKNKNIQRSLKNNQKEKIKQKQINKKKINVSTEHSSLQNINYSQNEIQKIINIDKKNSSQKHDHNKENEITLNNDDIKNPNKTYENGENDDDHQDNIENIIENEKRKEKYNTELSNNQNINKENKLSFLVYTLDKSNDYNIEIKLILGKLLFEILDEKNQRYVDNYKNVIIKEKSKNEIIIKMKNKEFSIKFLNEKQINLFHKNYNFLKQLNSSSNLKLGLEPESELESNSLSKFTVSKFSKNKIFEGQVHLTFVNNNLNLIDRNNNVISVNAKKIKYKIRQKTFLYFIIKKKIIRVRFETENLRINFISQLKKKKSDEGNDDINKNKEEEEGDDDDDNTDDDNDDTYDSIDDETNDKVDDNDINKNNDNVKKKNINNNENDQDENDQTKKNSNMNKNNININNNKERKKRRKSEILLLERYPIFLFQNITQNWKGQCVLIVKKGKIKIEETNGICLRDKFINIHYKIYDQEKLIIQLFFVSELRLFKIKFKSLDSMNKLLSHFGNINEKIQKKNNQLFEEYLNKKFEIVIIDISFKQIDQGMLIFEQDQINLLLSSKELSSKIIHIRQFNHPTKEHICMIEILKQKIYLSFQSHERKNEFVERFEQLKNEFQEKENSLIKFEVIINKIHEEMNKLIINKENYNNVENDNNILKNILINNDNKEQDNLKFDLQKIDNMNEKEKGSQINLFNNSSNNNNNNNSENNNNNKNNNNNNNNLTDGGNDDDEIVYGTLIFDEKFIELKVNSKINLKLITKKLLIQNSKMLINNEQLENITIVNDHKKIKWNLTLGSIQQVETISNLIPLYEAINIPVYVSIITSSNLKKFLISLILKIKFYKSNMELLLITKKKNIKKTFKLKNSLQCHIFKQNKNAVKIILPKKKFIEIEFDSSLISQDFLHKFQLTKDFSNKKNKK